LARADALQEIDSGLHASWISGCADREGGFRSPERKKPSLKDTANALQSLALLDCIDLVDRALCAAWVERTWLHSDRSFEQTRYAVTCLALLDAPLPGLVALLESSWLPRYRALVLSLRVDKQIDSVWNYVQIVSCLFDPSSADFIAWTAGLAENVTEALTAFSSATLEHTR
jgi:hypothetical protein